jgi:hypothetical protein
VDPQDLAVIGEQVRPRRRIRWPFGVALGVAILLYALLWLTLVGYDTTLVVPDLKTTQGCREASVEGHLLGDATASSGGVEVRSLPPGDVVRIHRQLFHRTTYTFVAEDGEHIPVHPVVACTGP